MLELGVAVVHLSENQASLDANSITDNSTGTKSEIETYTSSNLNNHSQSQWLGLLEMAIAACIILGFCGVYFELLLKTTPHSTIYCRSFHLAFYSFLLGCSYVCYNNLDKILPQEKQNGEDGE